MGPCFESMVAICAALDYQASRLAVTFNCCVTQRVPIKLVTLFPKELCISLVKFVTLCSEKLSLHGRWQWQLLPGEESC